jgi:hypothetical protein
MTETILTLRITRRAIGAASLRHGELSLLDGRYLNSTLDRTIPAAIRYLTKLLTLTQPTQIVIDAPGVENPSTVTGRLLAAAHDLFAARGIPVMTVSRLDLLCAFGVKSVVDRREIRELVRILWPDVERVTNAIKPLVADAAAAAVYTECRLALGPPPP